MPLVTLLIYILLVVGLVYLAVWALGKLAPGHPPIIDNILWVVCVVIIVIVLLQALGVMGSEPLVPRIS